MFNDSILFENESILAVKKPEGLASIPGRAKGGASLLELLQSAFAGKLYVVHRLDKEVSSSALLNVAEEKHEL